MKNIKQQILIELDNLIFGVDLSITDGHVRLVPVLKKLQEAKLLLLHLKKEGKNA